MRSISAVTVALLAQAMGIVAVPTNQAVDAEKLSARADCVVNAAYHSDWVEAGLSRYRTYFSSWNTNPAKFCEFFCPNAAFFGGINCQCWEEKGVSWMADASFARGPIAQGDYDAARDASMRAWIIETECRTG